MYQPTVSVLLPIRDAGATLDACLESLAAQTLGDFEVVAVDHGSTDQTPAILKRWINHLPNLHLLHHEGGSLLDALNAGLAQCKGRYVARMDSDDLCLPERLQAQAEALDARPEISMLGTQVEMFSASALSPGYQAYQAWVNSVLSEEDIARELFVECPLPHPTWMLRRELYGELGGYQEADLPEDYHLLLRAVASGARLAKLPQPLLRWREHAGRHSRLHPRYGRHAFFKLKARFLKTLFIRDRPACVWGVGDRGRLLIRYLLEEGVDLAFAVGLAEADGRPTMAHGIKVLLPEDLPPSLPGPLVVCVGSPGVHAQMRALCAEKGWIERKEWCFAS